MRYGVYLAVFFSIILIGMASWVRFDAGRAGEIAIGLEEVRMAEVSQQAFEASVKDYLEKPATSTAPVEKLTSTDLIGRQLLSDYVSLATNNQANDSSILALANQYIESIPTLVAADAISYGEIKIASTNEGTMSKYSSELVKIQGEYAKQYEGLNTMSLSSEASAETYASFATRAAKVYRDTALKLKNMMVPAPLAQNHFLLVNIYLTNAAAMDAISKISDDPATAFAGIVLLGESIVEEQELLVKIGEILLSNDV
jgi:hypothetical protein